MAHHRYEIVGAGNKQHPHRPPGARPWFLVCFLAGIVTLLCWIALEGWPASFLTPAESGKTLRNVPTNKEPTTTNGSKTSKPEPPVVYENDDENIAPGVDDDDHDASDGVVSATNGDDDDDHSTSTTAGLGDVAFSFVAGDDDGEESKALLEDDDMEPTSHDEVVRDKQPIKADDDTTEPTLGNNDDRPDVAWIVSFGGSGTSYTILNIEALTGQSTASNYAQDYEDLIPVKESYEFGPYVRSPDKPLPPKYILTKTHCGGYCMDCPPSLYVFESAYDFQEACRTAQISVDGKLVEQVYESEIPKRAVHLVRSPFDNLVGRFHLSVRRQAQRTGVKLEELVEAFSDTADGLQNWCQYLDNKYQEQESKFEVLQKYRDVPCHAEWFRYIQWHNLADTVLRDLDIPVHYLWYHNYTSGFNKTVDNLLDFLSLERHHDAYPWYAGHSYRSFFSPKMTQPAITMMKDLASANTWRLIKDYIAEYTDMEMLYDTPEELVEEESNVTHDDDDDDVGDETPNSATMVDQMSNDPDPQVVWLLSFPNSGTSYTIMNVEKMANVTTGTTYARDLAGAVAITPHGPFLHRQDKRVPHYILTKTHCAGFCNQCKPSGYIPSADPYHFTQACTSVERPGSRPGDYDYFPEYLPVKAVHLFRDPFDNIVSRMHLEMKKEHADFATSKDGLANYCSYLDGMYTQEERDAFDEETHKLFQNVPCHADFYRYTVWHNQALDMTERLNLPVLYLHYEEYTNAYAETTSKLFDFLNLKAMDNPLEFKTGKVYRYLWEDNMESVQALVQHVATPATWERIRHYFED